MAEVKSNALPNDLYRTVIDLRDKFKHGHHIIKILESQLETARQNISLLQGQVRLANETIDNLKQHFSEADLTLSYLTDNNSTGNPGERHNNDVYNKHNVGVRESDSYASHASGIHVRPSEDYESQGKLVGLINRSPKQSVLPKSASDAVEHVGGEFESGERAKSPGCQSKAAYGQERPKSPYEQQLRQVLDALQDEDPRRVSMSAGSHESTREMVVNVSQGQHCMCPECVPSSSASAGTSGHGRYQGSPSSSRVAVPCSCDYGGTEMHYHDECAKHSSKVIGSSSSDEHHIANRSSMHDAHRDSSIIGSSSASSSATHYIPSVANNSSRSIDYSSSQRCTGPCCTTVDHSKGYKIVEALSPALTHYLSSRPARQHQSQQDSRQQHHDSNGKIIGHCDDKCRCHAFVNYAPFGYQVVESAPGIPQTIQPISPSLPSKKNKRYHPVAPGDEPPHLKYTKVKRIDGSKVAAQKTIQDFSKRRFHPYNPRWDLDLLIVPPPIPALDLISILGGDANPGYEIDKEANSSAATSVDDRERKSDSNAATTDPYEAAVGRSKVINSGGTVIVLTEGENVDTSHPTVAMHATPKQQVGSTVSLTDDERVQKERRQLADMKNPANDNAMRYHGSSTTGLHEPPSQLSYAPPQSNESSINSMEVDSFNRSLTSTYNSPASAQNNNSVRFKIPEALPPIQNASSVITSVSIKKERNNNTFTSNAFSIMLQPSQTDQLDNNGSSKELPGSNLTARYEQVLFQRNQDFSKIGTDDDYAMQNRLKGKVH
eukprot:gene15835-17431_t